MKNRLFAFTALFLGMLSSAWGNSFMITQPGMDDFPNLNLMFTASDASGSEYPSFSAQDLSIIDFNVDVSQSAQVKKYTYSENPGLNLTVTISQSAAMNAPFSGGAAIDAVRQEMTQFISQFPLTDESQMAITTYNNTAKIIEDFTKDKVSLVQSLSELSPLGSPYFQPAFFDDKAGAHTLLKSRDYKKRRVMILIAARNFALPPNINELIKNFTNSNIHLYTIFLNSDYNYSLDDAVVKTGGKSFIVSTRLGLNSALSQITAHIKSKNIYELTWESLYSCSDDLMERNLDIKLKKNNIEINTVYSAPDGERPYVGLSSENIDFGSPPANAASEREITLTAHVADFTVESVEFIPHNFFTVSDWGGAAAPFVIEEGQERTLKIAFNPGLNKGYKNAAMIINGSPCPATAYLSGGIEEIEITSPNGGEVFSECDSIEITWDYSYPEKEVTLSSSINGGAPKLISSSASGGRHMWKPTGRSDKYTVIARPNPAQEYLWAKKYGSNTSQKALSLAFAGDGVTFYVAGWFEGAMSLGGFNLKSEGQKDIFMARMDIEGNVLWAKSAGGPYVDSAAGVTIDSEGNALLTGVCYQGVKFGSLAPITYSNQTSYLFLARYPKSGGAPEVTLFGAKHPYTEFEAYGERIRYNNGKIMIRGRYLKDYKEGGFELKNFNYWRQFSVEFDENFELTGLTSNPQNFQDYSRDFGSDRFNFRYNAGGFAGKKSFGEIELTSAGGQDIYLTKFGTAPVSSDESDSAFTIKGPEISVTRDTINYGKLLVGEKIEEFLESIITNSGTDSLVITEILFEGPDSASVALADSSIINTVLYPGDYTDIAIEYTSRRTGPLEAKIIIRGECSPTAIIYIIAEGICGGFHSSYLDVGKSAIETTKDTTIVCAFKNANTSPVWVHPKLEGPQYKEFAVSPSGAVKLDSGECLDLTVSFTPLQEGIRNAKIDFQLPDTCETAIIDLVAEGEEVISSAPWQESGAIGEPSPIPASGLIYLPAPRHMIIEELNIFNLHGGAIPENKFTARYSPKSIEIDISRIKPGFYILELKAGGKRFARPIIISR